MMDCFEFKISLQRYKTLLSLTGSFFLYPQLFDAEVASHAIPAEAARYGGFFIVVKSSFFSI